MEELIKCGHDVQFYRTQEYLYHSVSNFIAGGLTKGRGGLVVASKAHMKGIEASLIEKGVAVADLKSRGQLMFLDALQIREQVVINGEVQAHVFTTMVNGLMDSLERFGAPRIFGEVVQLLCDVGDYKSCQQLEEMWNEIGQKRKFHLLCGYHLDTFDEHKKRSTFQHVCSSHAMVRPAEDFMELASRQEQEKMIADLQQQALALKFELNQNRLLMRQLAAEKAKAEVADRLKTVFLANISHELRTPLSAIIGLAELTMDDPSCNPTCAESLEVILSSGRAMNELVGELLDVSKMEADALQVDVQKFSIKKVVREAFEMMKVIAVKKCLEFEVEMQHMPASIMSDPSRFRQIMINMLGNAIKFTPKGKVSCLIKLQDRRGRNDEAMLECFVRDTGIGITAEQSERLFAPFAQGDSSITRRFGGTGLGLFLSRKLAQQLGGDLVLVESRPNHGTTFLCTLNVGAVEAAQGDRVRFATNAEQEPEPSHKPPPPRTLRSQRRMHPRAHNKGSRQRPQRFASAQGFAKLHPCRVLVVDDVKVNRDILVRFIEKAGYHKDSIATAENGQEAFKLIKASPDFNLVLMDVHMPVCDGITATRLIRDWYSQPEQAARVLPYVAAVSASTAESRKYLNTMDGLLDKPVNFASLLHLLETALNHQRQDKHITPDKSPPHVTIDKSPPASPCSMVPLSPLPAASLPTSESLGSLPSLSTDAASSCRKLTDSNNTSCRSLCNSDATSCPSVGSASSPIATPDLPCRALSGHLAKSYDIFSQYSDSECESPPQFKRALASQKLPSETGDQVGCARKETQLSGRACKRVRTEYDTEAVLRL